MTNLKKLNKISNDNLFIAINFINHMDSLNIKVDYELKNNRDYLYEIINKNNIIEKVIEFQSLRLY